MSTDNPPNKLPSQPAFTITSQLASHKQGIVNVPAGVDSYFGEHGKIVVVTLPNDQRIHCPIERKKTSKHGASFSHPSLKEYFGNKAQRDWEYRVKISGTNTVTIRPIFEQPVEEQPVDEQLVDEQLVEEQLVEEPQGQIQES